MDWDAAIERNREALKRILASLVAMAGLGNRQSAIASRQSGSGLAQAADGPTTPDCLLPTADCRLTLPRHLHRAVLRLLRPAESAARRLVIVAARGLVVELPRPRLRKPDPKARHAALRSLGIAVVLSPVDFARAAAGKFRRPHPETRALSLPKGEPRRAVLPLFDPPQYPFRLSRRTVSPHTAPRILSFDGALPHRLPPPPSPDDPVDATRLSLRLQAVAAALDDLPGHARRFARWKARRDAARARQAATPVPPLRSGGGGPPKAVEGAFARISPLRPGRPPGGRAASSRRPAHEVHETLADLQYFAVEALQQPDTS